jgi:hypothetical protein
MAAPPARARLTPAGGRGESEMLKGEATFQLTLAVSAKS